MRLLKKSLRGAALQKSASKSEMKQETHRTTTLLKLMARPLNTVTDLYNFSFQKRGNWLVYGSLIPLRQRIYEVKTAAGRMEKGAFSPCASTSEVNCISVFRQGGNEVCWERDYCSTGPSRLPC